MITDKSKVIRPTFYHHFKDKYEVLEYIVDEDIMKNIYEMVDSDMEYESLKIIFIRLEKNREFIKKAFKVEGQNSFKEILGYKIYNIFIRIIDKHELNELYYSNVLTKENMARYYTNGLISFIELWVDKGCEYSGIDMFEAYTYMVSHSIMDIIKKQTNNYKGLQKKFIYYQVIFYVTYIECKNIVKTNKIYPVGKYDGEFTFIY